LKEEKSPQAASSTKLVSQVAVILLRVVNWSNKIMWIKFKKKRTDTREDTNSGGKKRERKSKIRALLLTLSLKRNELNFFL
jgi:hypothetical protein